MKTCEKQYHNNDNHEMHELFDGPPNAKGFYKLGWKQALEWIRNEMPDDDALYYIKDKIDEELDNDKTSNSSE